MWLNLIEKKQKKNQKLKKNDVIFRFAEFVEISVADNVEISVANVVER